MNWARPFFSPQPPAPSPEPTAFAEADSEMLIAREATCGPVAPLFRFRAKEEAIAMANDTEFGLATYFYTRGNARVWRVSEQLESGGVGVNCGVISSEAGP